MSLGNGGNTQLKSARLIYRGIHIPKGSCGRERLQVLFVHFVEPLRNGFDLRLVDLSVCDLFRIRGDDVVFVRVVFCVVVSGGEQRFDVQRIPLGQIPYLFNGGFIDGGPRRLRRVR